MTPSQQLTIEQAISRAKKAIKQGNTALAIKLYNAVLQNQPNHTVAKKGLRKIQNELPRNQSTKAETANPPQDQINTLINLYHSGQTAEAEKACRELLKAYPQSLVTTNILGAALRGQGKLQEAVASYDKAIQIRPDFADACYNRGNALKDLGRLEEAVASYDKAIQIRPDFAEAYSNRGNALKDLGRLEEAVASYDKAIQIRPDFAEAYSNRGNALQDLGRLEEAVASYDKAIQIRPDYAEAYGNLCELYDKIHMVDKLEKVLLQAQEVLPKDDPTLLYRSAKLAFRENRLEKVKDSLERVDPEKLPLKVKKGYSELLAKTYDKLGLFSNAFTQFEITNKIAKQSPEALKVDGQRYFEKISQLIRSWSNTAEVKWPENQAPNIQPSLAFLIGFPRSGTTLLDTILRSHPKVCVIEEKPIVAAMRKHIGSLPTAEFLTHLNNHQIASLSEVYFEELYSHITIDSSHQIIIDKLPLNIINVGLIHRVFPNSKFILALRHPYDCTLSCFMQDFVLNDAMANFFTLQQSAELYNATMFLWKSYNSALNMQVCKLKYEDLILDLQGTVEPLLNFLDLDWNDNLLNYQQTALSRERIHTPSYYQVTQSLYKQAEGRWRNYQGKMEEVVSLLEPWVNEFEYQVVLQNQPNHTVAKKGLHKAQNELPRNQSTKAETANPPQDQINRKKKY